ncbi:MAG: triphosphoribosyl-dephospho-CoA synthase [Bacilli bacterium]|nr:triphosphoribosyl-dephospho-CoA synthase [Bacilli bacterium]
MDRILEDRENRINNLKKFMINDNLYVVVKANIPGINKKIFYAYFFIRFFKKLLKRKYNCLRIEFFDSFDGPYYFLEITDIELITLKKELIILEDSHPLGRFIDLDVFRQNVVSISRHDLGCDFRKCFLCDNDAYLCIREKTHSIEEILGHIQDILIHYLLEDISNLAFDAITLELLLEPKFGLVCENSVGSHTDMDCSLMKKSRDVIVDFFGLLFLEGMALDYDEAFKKGREIGKIAEEYMFTVTKGINTHKGLIFCLGIVCIACGEAIINNSNFNKVFENVAFMTRNILDEFNQEINTEGKRLFHEYGFLGIRGEVNKGMQSVIKALKVLEKYNLYSDEALMMTLISLVRECDDSVLLKRAGSIEKYNYFKNKISEINEYDINKINDVTKEAIKENISIGGAADLLIVTLFLHMIKERYLD